MQQLMEDHGVPAGKIYKAPDMMEDPHFAARDAIVHVPHPEFDEIYGGLLGKSADEIAALKEAGTI